MEQVSSLKTGVKYKDTPIGKIPVDWEVVRLGDVCDIIGGSTPSTKNKDYWGGDIPFATPTDITSLQGREISDTKQNITQEGLSSCGAHLLPMGSVLLTSRATLGACAINTKPVATNQGFASLVCKEKAYNWFIFYKMIALQQELDKLGSGSTFKEVSKSSIRSLNFSLPPLPEQKKIADILSTADDAIEKTTQVIEKTKELKKGLMQKLFTLGIGHKRFKRTEIGDIPEKWALVAFKELLSKEIILEIQDGNHGSAHPKSSDYVSSGVPFIMANNLVNGTVDIRNSKFIPKKQADKLRVGFSKQGDILLSHKGTIGRVAIVPEIKDYIMLTPQVTYYRIGRNDKLLNVFMKYFMESEIFQENILNLSKQSTRNYIGISQQKNLFMVMPSIVEQRQIAEILSSVDEEIKKESMHRDQLGSLKKSLMQVLLTGKLRVAV